MALTAKGLYSVFMQRLLVILLISIAGLSAASACGGNGPEGTGESGTRTPAMDTLTVRGLVVEVSAESLTDLASLTIRDEPGDLWTLTAEGFVGMTPSHLREHQLLGQPVSVSYKETPDGLVAIRITD